jgi:hypothetical protein
MSAVLAFSLLLQALSIALLRHRLGETWLRRPVTLLVLASVVYDGVSQVLLSFRPVSRWDGFRIGVPPGWTDEATLVMSAGMVALTVAYLLTGPERSCAGPARGGREAVARVLDWRWLAAACLPLAALTYAGRGYNSSLTTGAGASVASEFASEFFVLLVVLASFSLVLARGGRWFLPALAAQSLLLAAAGERTPVLVDAVALVVLLAWSGVRPGRRQIQAACALTAVAMLAVTGVRTEQGRSLYYRDSGLGTRAAALAGGLSGASSQDGPGLVSQAAERLDGTAFAGAAMEARSNGYRLSAAYVPESLLLIVPSSLWGSKLTRRDRLNPALAQISNFGLQHVNFLPGLAGLYSGFLAPGWLIILLGALGALLGWAERGLFRSFSAVRLVLLAGSVIAVLDYEKGLPGMLIAFRAAAVTAAAVRVVQAIRSRQESASTLQGSHQGVTTTATGLPLR